jgi:hypothetical protein
MVAFGGAATKVSFATADTAVYCGLERLTFGGAAEDDEVVIVVVIVVHVVDAAVRSRSPL